MKELLEFLYHQEELIQEEVGEIIGISQGGVSYLMRKFSVEARPAGGRLGSHNKNWKGGTQIDHGYIFHLIPGHSNADRHGYVGEAQLIVESIIGDYLPDGSVTHHFNKDKKDNRPENLMYFSSQSPHMEHHEKLKRLKREDIKWTREST